MYITILHSHTDSCIYFDVTAINREEGAHCELGIYTLARLTTAVIIHPPNRLVLHPPTDSSNIHGGGVGGWLALFNRPRRH